MNSGQAQIPDSRSLDERIEFLKIVIKIGKGDWTGLDDRAGGDGGWRQLPDGRSDDEAMAPNREGATWRKYSHRRLCFPRPVSTAEHRTTMPIGRKQL